MPSWLIRKDWYMVTQAFVFLVFYYLIAQYWFLFNILLFPEVVFRSRSLDMINGFNFKSKEINNINIQLFIEKNLSWKFILHQCHVFYSFLLRYVCITGCKSSICGAHIATTIEGTQKQFCLLFCLVRL